MTFDRDEQFLHEKLSAELHPAPAEAAPEKQERGGFWHKLFG